jgi:uncharacterized membrane protein YuzA (DUF378 family)
MIKEFAKKPSVIWGAMMICALASITLGWYGFFGEGENVYFNNFGEEPSLPSYIVFLVVALSGCLTLLVMQGSFKEMRLEDYPLAICGLGALYLGLAGLFNYCHLIGEHSGISMLLFKIVGIAGAWALIWDLLLGNRKKFSGHE